MAETSDRVATVAAQLVAFEDVEDFLKYLQTYGQDGVDNIQAVAASALRQHPREPEPKEEDSPSRGDEAASTNAAEDFSSLCSRLRTLLAEPLPGGRGFQRNRDMEIQALAFRLANCTRSAR